MRRVIACALAALVATSAAPSHADEGFVELQRRIGNNVEDIEYVATGPLAGSVVAIDGYDLRVVGTGAVRDEDDDDADDDDGRSSSSVGRAFNLEETGAGLHWSPRGIAWVQSLGLFAVVDLPDEGSATWNLAFFDHHGRPSHRRPIVAPAALSVDHVEALQYIPPGSSFYPDHLALVVWDFAADELSQIAILTRDGEVVHHFGVGDFLAVAGVTFVDAPSRFVVSALEVDYSRLVVVGTDGTPVAETTVDDLTIEGVAALPSGEVAAGSYGDGAVLRYDASLGRLPAGDDRSLFIPPGVSFGTSVAWDSKRRRHLLLSGLTFDVMTAPASLASRSPLIDGGPVGIPFSIDYVASTDRVAVMSLSRPQRIWFFDAATGDPLPGGIDLAALFPPPRRAWRITHIGSTGQFAVQLRTLGFPDEVRRVHLVNPDGTPDRTLELDRDVFGLAWRPGPSGGRLVADARDAIVEYDLDGHLRRMLPPSPIVLADIAAGGGALVGVSGDSTSTFVRFDWPD